MTLLERFIEYCQIWTTSDERVEDRTPSTDRQFDLARVLQAQLKELGAEDVVLDEYCYVYAKLPATPGCEKAPALGFVAHMDTAEFCGENVKPRVIENYDGGPVRYPNGLVLDPGEHSHLPGFAGRTLIVTEGDTLLGADDKAGVAEIMELCRRLLQEPRPHGPVCIAFCPDEEIGGGTRMFDIPQFGADFAYTVDGGMEGEINWECFNAAGAHIEITGKSIHPGEAKDKMVNAAVLATEINLMLPKTARPEHTEGYEGFFGLMHMEGSVEHASLDYIIRDHDPAKFDEKKDCLRHIVKILNERYGEGTVCLSIKEQYRNMREALAGCEHLVENAKKAAEMAGVVPFVAAIRGGTDGAQLSYKGLPCPNLGTGGFCFHGPLEHISLEGMEKVVKILENLVDIYAREEK